MLLDHDQALGSILGIISSPPFQALAGTAPIIPIRKATQRRVPCPKEVMAGAPWSRGVWEVLDACAQKPGSFVKWLRETGRTGINRGLVPARCRDAKLLTPQGWQDWKRAPFCASDWLLPRHSKMQLQQLSTLNVCQNLRFGRLVCILRRPVGMLVPTAMPTAMQSLSQPVSRVDGGRFPGAHHRGSPSPSLQRQETPTRA